MAAPRPSVFAVYRNNVAAIFGPARWRRVPDVVRKLVGDEFFAAMAVIFLRAHPPRQSRILMLYGGRVSRVSGEFFPCGPS
jgi:hypothetical protein